MSSKKAFTLAELLVAMTLSLIVIGTIGACYLMLSKTNKMIVDEASMITKVQYIKQYIVKNKIVSLTYQEDDQTKECFSYVDNNVYYKDILLQEDVENFEISFENKDVDDTEGADFVYCTITYGSKGKIEFVVDLIQQD